MDKSWMTLSRVTPEYENGVDSFLDFAFKNSSLHDMILCPCVRCVNSVLRTRDEVKEHVIVWGFIKGYTYWVAHGELTFPSRPSSNISEPSASVVNTSDNLEALVGDAFGVRMDADTIDDGMQIPNSEAKKFYQLIDASQQELYPGCRSFTSLSFTLRLLHLKCLGNWSNEHFNMLLDLLRSSYPEGVQLPKSYYEAEKIMKELGLGYDKIDACPNDCTLYWGEKSGWKSCPTCQHPRWVICDTDTDGSIKKIAHKSLWHFPLKPRLQRLFMSSKTASFMRWHDEGRINDGCMRHPADSPAWKTFDFHHRSFSRDSRNVRLGLAADGFNPFKNMSTSHSTLPVILIPYNLPPWMCMKQPHLILSLLVPGPNAPGNNLDVYLEPLISELKDLWENGLDTYDASRKENFQMHAALLWTISDFPGYANLSGWSTKGKLACPICNTDTCSLWLKNSKKHCYMGHRKLLHTNHRFRRNRRNFDGKQELGKLPPRKAGSMILKELEGFEVRFWKQVNDNPKLHNWLKNSIFNQLPYWKDNLLPYNLDAMHTEKNVSENIWGTLLDIDGMTKDHYKSRCDLKDMGIRPELHPVIRDSGKAYLPPSQFRLSEKEKQIFCKVLKNVKVPDGYARNIARCVQLKPPKISGLKSHDNHILMPQLLPIAIRKIFPKSVRYPLLKLSRYFRNICSKEINPQDLPQLEEDIAVTLCELEMRIAKDNKINRQKKTLDHRTGKNTFAQVSDDLMNKEKEPPTRVRLFKACYLDKNQTTKSSAVAAAVAAMDEKTSQLPADFHDEIAPDDVFAQVIGKDGNGRVRMMGGGICPSDIWGIFPSRGASFQLAMEYKSALDQQAEINKKLMDDLADLRSIIMSQSGTSSARSASSVQQPVETSLPLKVNNSVAMKSCYDASKTVAEGILKSLDPNYVLGGGQVLGKGWCLILVQVSVDPLEVLVRPFGPFDTIGDVIGVQVPWPQRLVCNTQQSDAADEAEEGRYATNNIGESLMEVLESLLLF